jgi:hypothetical protein
VSYIHTHRPNSYCQSVSVLSWFPWCFRRPCTEIDTGLYHIYTSRNVNVRCWTRLHCAMWSLYWMGPMKRIIYFPVGLPITESWITRSATPELQSSQTVRYVAYLNMTWANLQLTGFQERMDRYNNCVGRSPWEANSCLASQEILGRL